MGYKYDDKYIKCPFYKRVVTNSNKRFIGIECLSLPVNLGFDADHIVRLKNMQDLYDYTDIFCKDQYTTCPYYQSYINMLEERV